MKKLSAWQLALGTLFFILSIDTTLGTGADASVLLVLLFGAAVGQGIIALAAASDLAKGKWLEPVRAYMHQYYPLLLIFPGAFLIFSRHLEFYNWTQHPTAWLNPAFFIIRNVIFLSLPLLFAHLYVRASRDKSEKVFPFAVLYIAFFVISQSFIAFDLVMTFEYPWINTLMGGFFFVEAFYAGIAFCAIMAGYLAKHNKEKFKKAYDDFTIMIMGWALLWAGLFYSQYLVIWYGNIPEEVSYVAKRMEMPLIRNLGIYILITLFIIPFVVLISRKIKNSIPIVRIIAILVFTGLIAERIIYLYPAAPLNILNTLLQLLLMVSPFLYILNSQRSSLPLRKGDRPEY